jgi:IS5 family transposase
LLDEQTIQEVNEIVINYGHSLLKKKEEELLRVKADSFPVGANDHFPTDMNLLWDSARKCIDIAEWFREKENISGWRKSKAWKREIKSIFRASSKASSSGGKNKESRLHYVVNRYLQLCEKLEAKVNDLLSQSACCTSTIALAQHFQLVYFHEMLNKHSDLLDRRIIGGEVMPSGEKLYSIFETHSEWLTKRKKFNPVEIGHNVLIANDQFNFIIHHHVLEKQADALLNQDLANTLVKKYPGLIESLSLDKGFYSKPNKDFVEKIIPKTIMPKKGKRKKAETVQERESEFIKLRNAHSAVESNINQLEHNGLGRCPDRGIKNFKRYTSASVLAYNLHKLGEYISRGQILKKAA